MSVWHLGALESLRPPAPVPRCARRTTPEGPAGPDSGRPLQRKERDREKKTREGGREKDGRNVTVREEKKESVPSATGLAIDEVDGTMYSILTLAHTHTHTHTHLLTNGGN